MSSTTSTSTLEEELLQLAAVDVEQFKILFKSNRDGHTAEATRACIRHLAAHGLDEAGKRMLIWLLSGTGYLALLLDPEFLAPDKAVLVARIMRDASPSFVGDLQKAITGSKAPVDLNRLERVLRIFEEAVGDPGAFIPWLRALTQNADDRVRSKAAKVLCGLRPNIATIERQLKSEDARVRANAVEALWPVRSLEAVRLFNGALTDSSHRVVVNALIGLYRSGVKGSFDKLLQLAKSPVEVVRCAAIWGMGFLADPQAIPTLRILAKDVCVEVRSKALAVLVTFPGGLQDADPEVAAIEQAKESADAIEPAIEEAVTPLSPAETEAPALPDKVQSPEPPKRDAPPKNRNRLYIPV